MISVDADQIELMQINEIEGYTIPILVHAEHVQALLMGYTGSPEVSLSPEFCYSLTALILTALQENIA
jgi:hypothetical protein